MILNGLLVTERQWGFSGEGELKEHCSDLFMVLFYVDVCPLVPHKQLIG